MKNNAFPDPNTVHPVPNVDTMIYVKPTIRRASIKVGDFTYFADKEFEKQVTHHYSFTKDSLIIGKFCQIASGVEFVMNGANHQMNAVSTFPFYILQGWGANAPKNENLGLRGDTVVGNDVWLGQNATILPGVHIGDGAIIGLNSTVASDIPPYCVAVGNPAKVVKKRFDNELTSLLLRFKWWDKSIQEIKELIPLLTSCDIARVKEEIKKRLETI